ncbi:MAG TPA: hypothetical protein VGU46_13345 [Acidobacteriaceae bacterium]|nr:hypothetical protein [Acidobacteriaceae bacterium]
MKTIGLPARALSASAAFVLVGAVIFHICMRVLPGYVANHPEYNPGIDGYGMFKTAIGIAFASGLTLSLPLLTLPGIRRRRRGGRPVRTAVACGLVVGGSLLFAEEGFSLGSDVLFAAWLAYLLSFTFVRYGLRDEARRSSRTKTDRPE